MRDERISVENYIPQGHEPYGGTLKQMLAEAYREMIHPYPSVKLPSFPKFNYITGGFRSNEYTVLVGATGKGKTTICSVISADLARAGVPHYVASIETGPKDFVKRMMSAVRKRDWNTGEAVPLADIKQFHQEFGHELERDNVFLGKYEDRVKSETMLADIAYYVKHHEIKIAIIDNFNFMTEVTSTTNQVREEDRVMHDYIMFCKRVPVHLVMIHHPRKSQSGRVENEFDVKGSSTAVQEAQNVLIWNEVDPKLVSKEKNDPTGIREGDRELKIAKMRRRGKFMSKRLIMRTDDGVSYREVGIL